MSYHFDRTLKRVLLETCHEEYPDQGKLDVSSTCRTRRSIELMRLRDKEGKRDD